MTVVRNLPSQLILAHAPWLLGGGLIVCIVACASAGLALIAAGQTAGLWTVLAGAGVPLALFALCIKRNQAIFDARAGTVTLQRRTIWRYEAQTIPLLSVREAALEELKDTARPVLVVDGAPVPLVEAHEGGNAPRRAVEAINIWLAQA
ncbi:MAG: hypothetical protein AAGM84_04435 [Pseudomonadota bacterium]